jgi:hypothetical protein
MTTGDTLEVYLKVADRWGDNLQYQLQPNLLDCNLQYLDANESRELGAKGIERFAEAYFDEPHGLAEDHVVRHIARADGSPVTPRYFEVKATYEEGPPGQTWLYIAILQQITQRGNLP